MRSIIFLPSFVLSLPPFTFVKWDVRDPRRECIGTWTKETELGHGVNGKAYIVSDRDGNRGVQKIMKKSVDHKNALYFRSAYEVLYRLNNQCPDVAQVLDFCSTHEEYYFVYKYMGSMSAKSMIEDRQGVDGSDFKNWLLHGLYHGQANCVARQGLVMYDIKLEHMLVDPSGRLIPKGQFVSIDTDGWPPASWFVDNSLSIQAAAAVNRFFLVNRLFHPFMQSAHKTGSESDWNESKQIMSQAQNDVRKFNLTPEALMHRHEQLTQARHNAGRNGFSPFTFSEDKQNRVIRSNEDIISNSDAYLYPPQRKHEGLFSKVFRKRDKSQDI